MTGPLYDIISVNVKYAYRESYGVLKDNWEML